jgi:hypothetical protein
MRLAPPSLADVPLSLARGSAEGSREQKGGKVTVAANPHGHQATAPPTRVTCRLPSVKVDCSLCIGYNGCRCENPCIRSSHVASTPRYAFPSPRCNMAMALRGFGRRLLLGEAAAATGRGASLRGGLRGPRIAVQCRAKSEDAVDVSGGWRLLWRFAVP